MPLMWRQNDENTFFSGYGVEILLTPKDYSYLYRITANVTPLDTDCGRICRQACCQPNLEDTLGIYLYPGEESMYSRHEDWLIWEAQDPRKQFFPASWPSPVYFVKCTRLCQRELRPLACRFFPLTPHLLRTGELLLIHEDMPLPYKCPLIIKKTLLKRVFIETVAQAWQLMVTDQRIRDMLEQDSRDREALSLPAPEIIWYGSTIVARD